MGSLSLKSKTFIMSGIVIGLFLVMGAVGNYTVRHLDQAIHTVSLKSLPAVRNMTLVDMMHDAIRAVVYRSLVEGPSAAKEIEEEFKEFSVNISSHMTEIKDLKLDGELNEKILKSEELIKQYQQDAGIVVKYAISGNKEAALAHLPVFIKSFDQLAEDLGSIGEYIQNKAAQESKQSQVDSAWLSSISFYIGVFGVVISLVISFLAYKFISGLTVNLLSITRHLKTESQTIVQTAQTMSEVASRLSEASTQQAASLQETVASLDEISAMVSRNADSSANSVSMSKKSNHYAQEGKKKAEIMLNSVEAISEGNNEIIQQMQHTNHQISEIVRVIHDISQKTQVINDIVFQTKLLSFNASVEAARAGEHGKGFAVVAEEVGNLASMSGKAANEIKEMLSASVKKVTDIVDSSKGVMEGLIHSSKTKVEFGAVSARECAEALGEIMQTVSSVNDMVSEIATASNEQSVGVREINKAMSELDQVTQSNSSIAQQSSKSASGLEEQAYRLNTLVQELTKLVGGKEVQTKDPGPQNDIVIDFDQAA